MKLYLFLFSLKKDLYRGRFIRTYIAYFLIKNFQKH
jgi:hypothetical protein